MCTIQHAIQYKNHLIVLTALTLLTDNFNLSLDYVFWQVCCWKRNQCLSFTSERWIWFFCIAVIVIANSPRMSHLFAANDLRIFRFLAAKNLQAWLLWSVLHLHKYNGFVNWGYGSSKYRNRYFNKSGADSAGLLSGNGGFCCWCRCASSLVRSKDMHGTFHCVSTNNAYGVMQNVFV